MMTSNQYRAALEKLDISQVRAAALLGVDPRTSRRWALGQAEIPETAATVLRLMIKHKLKPEEIEKLK